ncbi:hypothetical protein L9F63_003676 [Diploptera punctata]|uniref:N(4)-(beta-N-acetylglucosaminyl)-L-asparaginase n=1 Tax=Diploptera punctata TaxID=6984 RepID=A0AAD7ZKF5_DIPPU|nr:hypothetical protein L9F63_003676 [Diploptera punctata]
MNFNTYHIFTVLFIFEVLCDASADKNGRYFSKMIPVVINTWPFTNATQKAWETLYLKKRSALDAVERGCSTCEEQQCDGTVGYGGSPNENGETSLDAMIFDGMTMDMGAVGDLRNVKSAISVARQVLERTQHSFLVGSEATKFALSMGFKNETLETKTSLEMWQKWKENNCQPNFWKSFIYIYIYFFFQNVKPDPTKYCGPYKPIDITRNLKLETELVNKFEFGEKNHDTIGMIAIDTAGRIAAGTSTNGAKFKIPGRVGDSPVPGAGAYADGTVGGAACTGDGDVMMRFLPSLIAVEQLRQGSSPSVAGEYAIRRIVKYYPGFVGAIVVLKMDGEYGAACHGIPNFKYSVCNKQLGQVTVETVKCM